MSKRNSNGVTRECSGCRDILPVERFSVNNQNYDGRDHYCRPCRSDRRRERLYRVRYEVLTCYSSSEGGMCTCCGETIPEFLSIDHINGGGYQHRKSIGKPNIYEWLRSQGFPEGYQVLCHNCNMAKGLYGKCPHEEQIRAVI